MHGLYGKRQVLVLLQRRIYDRYFFLVLVEPLGSSAVKGKKSRPCMYGCRAFGIRIPCALVLGQWALHVATHLGGLVILHQATECSLSGTKSSVEHVDKASLLPFPLVTISDIQRPRL